MGDAVLFWVLDRHRYNSEKIEQKKHCHKGTHAFYLPIIFPVCVNQSQPVEQLCIQMFPIHKKQLIGKQVEIYMSISIVVFSSVLSIVP